MAVNLKHLKEQTIVITGATSGIGLATARLAARKGARLVVTSRNEQALRQLEEELKSAGHEAVAVPADVASFEQVQHVADAAVGRFGSFDTWVNNAGVSIYGRLEEVSLEDHRRLFETNYWGVVHGSLVALRHLRGRASGEHGGALINIGSAFSDRAAPLQGAYSASKHAVKGFTDALRMELEEAGLPISVTLIKPAAIDTPYVQHAKNYLPSQPMNPPPVYAPETVARAILYAAAHPERDIFVGAAGKILSVMEKYAPRLTDYYMEKTMFRQQQSEVPNIGPRRDALHAASEQELHERGGYPGHVARSSLYTRASLHPMITTALLGAAGLAVSAVLLGSAGEPGRSRRSQSRW